MKKSGLWIVVILVFAGVILGTLGTWSVPLGNGISAFWPAFVVQAAGSIWFGGWGVLAAVLFPIFTNTLANVGWSGILGFIPANLAQGLIPAWAFRYFHADPAIPGRKGLVFYAIWGAIIPAFAGGMIGSVAVILFGNATWSEYPLLVVRWSLPNMVVSLLVGVPVMRELTPLWRDLGILVKGWWVFERTSDRTYPQRFQDMPIQLKLVLAMGGAGLGPLLILSLLELIQNGGKSATGSMMPLLLSISMATLVLAVGFLSQETVRPLQKLKEQVESLMQYRNKELAIERTDEIGQLGQAFAFLLDDWRRAEASLQASEEKYRTLVENLNVGVFQSTLDGTFLHANSAVIHMAGYDNWDEFKQLTAASLYADPADRQRLIAELMAQGRVWNVEVRSLKKDGTVYWIAISAVLVKDSEGKPTSILGSVMDITERKQAEEALARSEAKHRSLVESSSAGIASVDREGRFLLVNRRLCDLVGYPEDELLGRPFADLLHPDDLGAIMEIFQNAALNPTAEPHLEFRIVRKDGHVVFCYSVPTIVWDNGEIAGFNAIVQDITERKKAEEALRASEARIKSISNNFKEGMIYQVVIKPDGARQFTYLSDSVWELYGISPEEGMADSSLIYGRVHEDDIERLTRAEEEALKTLSTFRIETRIKGPSGQIRWSSLVSTPTKLEDGSVCWDGFEFIITERKRAEEDLRTSEERLSRFMDSASDSFYLLDSSLNFVEMNKKALEIIGKKKEDVIGKNIAEIVPDVKQSGRYEKHLNVIKTAVPFVVEDFVPHPIFGNRHFVLTSFKVGDGLGVIAHDITERKRKDEEIAAHQSELQRLLQESNHSRRALLSALEDQQLAENEIRKRLTEMQAINHVSTALRVARTSDEMLPLLLDETLAALECEAGSIWLYNSENEELRIAAARGWFENFKETPIKPGEGIAGTVFTNGQAHISLEFASDPLLQPASVADIPKGWSGICVPIRTADEIAGVIFVSMLLPREITTEQIKLLNSLTEMAGTALHRLRLHEETRRRLEYLEALRVIDQAIATSFDSQITFGVLLEQMTTKLRVDSAGVLLYNGYSSTLEYVAGCGFRTRVYEKSSLRLEEGLAGRAALERNLIQSPDLSEDPRLTSVSLVENEGFRTYFAMPLIAKGELKGVLEIFHRSPLRPDEDWLGFLEAVAGQAAIAIDNIQLFEDLQRSNIELKLAYDATIEGWSRALDLRDKETEGHTQRVTEKTLQLARAAGMKEDELVHVRRGALLHDIGKMGIPDAILLKPGKLTDEEWGIMHKHPIFAHELLSPIRYLKAAAIDIPYCHHEKWDGSGYPRGLKGEEIPLAARVFVVVDVWDALTSDRPYRPAWSDEEALDYIREQSGRHFDPNVVREFLKMIKEGAK